MPEPRPSDAESQGDRGAQDEQRRRHEGQQDVLDHVHGEEGRVVPLDDRLERDLDRDEPTEERDDPRSRHRVRGMLAVDSPDHGQVDDGDEEDRQGDERVEAPVEEDVRRPGRHEGIRPVGRHRRSQGR